MVDMLSAFDAVVEEGLIEEARKSNDFPLIPNGKYPATLTKYEDVSDRQKEQYDGRKNPLYGKPVLNLQVKLYGVGEKGFDELDGKERVHFIKVTPAAVRTEGKDGKPYLVGASKLGIHIVEVAGTQGKPFSKAIEWLEQNRFEVVVSKFKDMNTTAAINKLQ